MSRLRPLLLLAVLLGGACERSSAPENPAVPAQPEPAPKPSVQLTFPLTPGPGQPRRLAGGQRHVYEIDLAQDLYLDATFEQNGVDLTIDVFAPGLQRLYRVDSPNRNRGPEDVHLVARTAGRYRFEITTGDGAPPGTYTPILRAVRAPTETDRSQAAGDQAFSEAREIESDPARFWEAAAKYQKAIFLLQEAGDRLDQGYACFRLARLYTSRAEYREAQDLLSRAEKRFQETGDLHLLTLAVNEQGVCAEKLSDYARAAASYERALEISRRTGELRDQATILHNQGKLLQLQGRSWQALQSFREALALWRRQDGALARANEAGTLTGMGWAYQSTGDWQRALNMHGQALRLRNQLGDRGLSSISLTQIGSVWLALDPRRALPYLEKAYALQKGFPHAATLNGLGLAYRRLGLYAQAQSAYSKALELYARPADPGSQGITWTNLGWISLDLRQPSEASRRFEKGLHLARQTHNPMAESRALLGLAATESQRGNNTLARSRAEESLKIVESLRSDLTRTDFQTSYLAANESAYGLLVRILMEQHRQQPGGGFDLEALNRSEQSRARVLLDALRESRELDGDLQRTAPDLLARRRTLLGEISTTDARRRQPDTAPAEAAAAEQTLAELLDRLSEVEADIRSQRSHRNHRHPGDPAPPGRVIDQRQALLGPDSLLLEYYLASPHSYLWAVSAEGVQSFELPGRETLEPLLRATYAELAGASSLTDPVASRGLELSRILLGSLASRLRGKRLLIAADGLQQSIPFAALPSPVGNHAPLLLENEIVSISSLAVLAELRERAAHREPPPHTLALVADPVFDASDERLAQTGAARHRDENGEEFLPRLERTRDEAKDIANLLPAGQALTALDFDASRDLFTEGKLSGYRILHLATHGLQRIDHPELSALVLSRFDSKGNPRDGNLRVSDLTALHLPADLVVLSACETALGRETPGEGLVGLPQAFLAAGAQSVLVSLWQVEDESTAALMAVFYRRLLVDHLSPGKALREAQLAIRAQPRWRAPRYWAGFVLQGD